MAAPHEEEVSDKIKKQKIRDGKRKLLVGESIEVRSTEEGFHGSWHSATIIECKDLKRRVRYINLLCDDESDFLTDFIDVSPNTEGLETPCPIPLNYRCLIRPKPPTTPFPIDPWGLHYGLCVDVLFNDAWWEGVICDHEDGSDERLVFFPDIGDQQITKFKKLRISQNWDEIKETWKPCGNWVFLELIEEHEKDCPLFVSVRQLWCDLSAKEGFTNHVKEWACFVKSMWSDLVLEVLHDNLVLTAEHALKSIIQGSSTTITTIGSINSTNSKSSSSCRDVSVVQPILDLPRSEGEITSKCDSQAKRRKVDASVLGGQLEINTELQVVQKERKNQNGSISNYDDALPCARNLELSKMTPVVAGGPVTDGIGANVEGALVHSSLRRSNEFIISNCSTKEHGSTSSPANDSKTRSPVDTAEKSYTVASVPPMVEIIPFNEVDASIPEDGQGDVGLAADIGKEKNVLDTDSLGSYGEHPLALSTTVIRSVGKSVLFGHAGLRKEDAYDLVPCERSSHVDLVVSTTNRGVLCIPEDQLALYDCVVQKYGPIYGNTLHKSLAYFVNLFVRQLMAVILAVISCCIKTLSEAVLEEWDAVVATSLNLGFTVGWLQDHLFKLHAMWKRDRVLYCMQMEYSEASEKFDSLQARATLLRRDLANVETDLLMMKEILFSRKKAIADMGKLPSIPFILE